MNRDPRLEDLKRWTVVELGLPGRRTLLERLRSWWFKRKARRALEAMLLVHLPRRGRVSRGPDLWERFGPHWALWSLWWCLSSPDPVLRPHSNARERARVAQAVPCVDSLSYQHYR